MKIYLRLAKGWSKRIKNKDKEKCDIEGARLWIDPGGGIYCDLEHDLKDVETPTHGGN